MAGRRPDRGGSGSRDLGPVASGELRSLPYHCAHRGRDDHNDSCDDDRRLHRPRRPRPRTPTSSPPSGKRRRSCGHSGSGGSRGSTTRTRTGYVRWWGRRRCWTRRGLSLESWSSIVSRDPRRCPSSDVGDPEADRRMPGGVDELSASLVQTRRPTEGVHVLRSSGRRWVLASHSGRDQDDLWEADCESPLEPSDLRCSVGFRQQRSPRSSRRAGSQSKLTLFSVERDQSPAVASPAAMSSTTPTTTRFPPASIPTSVSTCWGSVGMSPAPKPTTRSSR